VSYTAAIHNTTGNVFLLGPMAAAFPLEGVAPLFTRLNRSNREEITVVEEKEEEEGGGASGGGGGGGDEGVGGQMALSISGPSAPSASTEAAEAAEAAASTNNNAHAKKKRLLVGFKGILYPVTWLGKPSPVCAGGGGGSSTAAAGAARAAGGDGGGEGGGGDERRARCLYLESVEEKVGGEVVLSNGSKFRNPSASERTRKAKAAKAAAAAGGGGGGGGMSQGGRGQISNHRPEKSGPLSGTPFCLSASLPLCFSRALSVCAAFN
jgi:hypothetical protein